MEEGRRGADSAGRGLAGQDSRPAQATRQRLEGLCRSLSSVLSDTFEVDPAAVAKFLSDYGVRELLVELGRRYAADTEPFSEAEAEKVLRDLAAERNVKAGALINGARVALTGQAVAPSLFAVMVALAKIAR